MTCQLIDGNKIASDIRLELSQEVRALKEMGLHPRLAVVMVGDDQRSRVYIQKKQEACNEVGIASSLIEPLPRIDQWVDPQKHLENTIKFLNESTEIHGILVQLPLPDVLNQSRIFDLIHPLKDVDVFSPENVGLLVQGRPRFLPCTPHAVQQMLARTGISISGKHVVIINRSDVVGKPLSSMLIQDGGIADNATVTVCHDRTPAESLTEICRTADIVVVAVGKPGFLTPNMVKSGAIVIDVGITKEGRRVVGDVAEGVRDVAGYLTPVPGGVGPVTVTMLLENTIKAARFQFYKSLMPR